MHWKHVVPRRLTLHWLLPRRFRHNGDRNARANCITRGTAHLRTANLAQSVIYVLPVPDMFVADTDQSREEYRLVPRFREIPVEYNAHEQIPFI